MGRQCFTLFCSSYMFMSHAVLCSHCHGVQDGACYSPLMVVIGFLITGFGLANLIPVLFSAASKLSAHVGWPASQGVAITTRIAYVGLLVGPLLIGPIAELVGLRLSLLSLLLAIVTMTIGWLLLSRTSSGTPWHIASDHSPRVPARTREPTSTP